MEQIFTPSISSEEFIDVFMNYVQGTKVADVTRSRYNLYSHMDFSSIKIEGVETPESYLKYLLMQIIEDPSAMSSYDEKYIDMNYEIKTGLFSKEQCTIRDTLIDLISCVFISETEDNLYYKNRLLKFLFNNNDEDE